MSERNNGGNSEPWKGPTWFASPVVGRINQVPFVDDQYASLIGSKTNRYTVISDIEDVQHGDYSECATVDVIHMGTKNQGKKYFEDQKRGEWAPCAVIHLDLKFWYLLVSSTLCTWNPTTITGLARCILIAEVASNWPTERFWAPYTRNGTRPDDPSKDRYVVMREPHTFEKFQGEWAPSAIIEQNTNTDCGLVAFYTWNPNYHKASTEHCMLKAISTCSRSCKTVRRSSSK
jgi:hypothetical protein